MKVLDSIWYTHGSISIGIVKAFKDSDVIVYYIGVGDGDNQSSDELTIANWGAKFDPIAGEILLP